MPACCVDAESNHTHCPKEHLVKQLSRLALLGLSITLAACTVQEGEKVDYKSAATAPKLEIPPDLSQITRDSRYTIPGGSVTALGYQGAQVTPASVTTAPNAVGDVRIERSGAQRWLVVNRPAEQLWAPLTEFWKDNGFLLILDQSNLGIMETDWAENRAKLPQDFIRSAIGRVFDSIYSTGERDKFRTRLERTAPGSTEIFISHRGMVEVYGEKVPTGQTTQTYWQPRAADPELEAEFLRRLMLKLGTPAEQARALVASSTPARSGARIANVGGQDVVVIDDGFDRAWRRVGLSLDRTGFTVEDRDRSKGTYFVRYVEPNADRPEQGFFSKIFGAGTPPAPIKYRVTVKSQGESTTIAVLNEAGAAEPSANAQRIVKLIADDLK